MNHMDCRGARTDCALRKQLLEMAVSPTLQRAPGGQAAAFSSCAASLVGQAAPPGKQAIARGCSCCAVLALHFLACQCGRPLEMLRDCRTLFDRHFSS